MSVAPTSNSSPTPGAQTLALNSLLEQPCSLEMSHGAFSIARLSSCCFKGINIGVFLSGTEYLLSAFHLVLLQSILL